MAESMAYGKDGMDIMIENAWFEKVPQVLKSFSIFT